MLQLHDVIQQMPTTEETKGFKNLLTKINNSELSRFDFGDVYNFDDETCTELLEYAHELAQHDILKLPFNPVYYSWSNSGLIYGIFIAKVSADLNDFNAIFFLANKKPLQLVLMGNISIKEFGKFPKVGENLQLALTGKILYGSPNFEFTHENAETELYQIGCYYALIFTALMESTHVKTRKTEVGVKLNQKREKRGLPKIMPFHTVYFEVDGKEYSTGGVAQGSSSQKRMHWRRGHIRKLSSGKITHVRPCLVGGIESETHVPKPTYVMRKKGRAA